VKIEREKYYRESVLPTLANTRRIGLLKNRLPRVEKKKKAVGRASLYWASLKTLAAGKNANFPR
jgi:hypothetical protein